MAVDIADPEIQESLLYLWNCLRFVTDNQSTPKKFYTSLFQLT